MDSTAMYFGFELFGLLVLVLLFAYLLVMALVVRNFKNVFENPLAFLIECAIWFIVPALPIFYFTVTKGLQTSTAMRWYIYMGVTVVIFHVLFHISGFYDYLFGNELAP